MPLTESERMDAHPIQVRHPVLGLYLIQGWQRVPWN